VSYLCEQILCFITPPFYDFIDRWISSGVLFSLYLQLVKDGMDDHTCEKIFTYYSTN
jgi:hypothetical protein